LTLVEPAFKVSALAVVGGTRRISWKDHAARRSSAEAIRVAVAFFQRMTGLRENLDRRNCQETSKEADKGFTIHATLLSS
jgi:hypothetical protein